MCQGFSCIFVRLHPVIVNQSEYIYINLSSDLLRQPVSLRWKFSSIRSPFAYSFAHQLMINLSLNHSKLYAILVFALCHAQKIFVWAYYVILYLQKTNTSAERG